MKHLAATNYQSEDFLYGYANDADFNKTIATHMHNGWEILFVKNGYLTYSVDGNVFDITPGSLIISRAGAVHSLCSKGSIHYERHTVVVTENLVVKSIIKQIPPDLHVLDVSDNKIFLDLFEKCGYYISHLQGANLEIALRALISELWINVYISTQIPSQSVASHSNAVIAKAVSFIKNHIREPLTVQQVSDALFISTNYLCQCFDKYMNVTPKQYIMLQKLQLVQQALNNGTNPTEICRYYGFRSYSTFYRNYQKVYGCRPSDSPKQSLQKIEL